MRLFAVAFSAVALLSVACSFTRTYPAWGNGSANELVFDSVQDADVGVVPVGVTRTIAVSRQSGGVVDCSYGSSAPTGQLRAQGGSINLPEHCASLPPVALTVVSASCPDDACTVQSTESTDGVVLRVSSTKTVTTQLVVVVREKATGTQRQDSVAIAFAPAQKIALQGTRADVAAWTNVVLPSVHFEVPSATVVDAAGKPMSLDAQPTAQLVGDAVDAYVEGYLVSRHAGTAKLVWDVPGVLHRELSLEVADAADAKELVVHSGLADDFTPVDLDATSTALAGDPLTTLEIAAGASSYAPTFFDVRARLVDGRLALVSLDDKASSAPPGFVDASTDDWSSELTLWRSHATGTGTLTFGANGLTRTMPVIVK